MNTMSPPTGLMSREQVERIDALAAKATPGPVVVHGENGRTEIGGFTVLGHTNRPHPSRAYVAIRTDAELYAALVNAWPQLREAALLSLEYSERLTKPQPAHSACASTASSEAVQSTDAAARVGKDSAHPCELSDGTLEHDWEMRTDWDGDPGVINGTRTWQTPVCRRCGIERQEIEE
jgi:hypothetical protein